MQPVQPSRSFLAWSALLALVLLLPRAAAAADTTAGDPAKAQLIGVIATLAEEGRQRWNQPQRWRDVAADFAQRDSALLKLPQAAILDALSQTLADHASLDGYVKWQLWSYPLALEKCTPGQLGALIRGLPALVSPPAFSASEAAGEGLVRKSGLVSLRWDGGASGGGGGGSGGGGGGKALRQQEAAALAKSGVGVAAAIEAPVGDSVEMDTNYQGPDPTKAPMTLEEANRRIAARREVIALANAPAVAYRDALLARLPTAGGLQSAARLEDVAARLEAGDPTTAIALARLCTQAADLDREKPTAALRQSLTRRLQGLLQTRRVIPVAVSWDEKGNLQIQRQTVSLDTESYKKLRAAFTGQ